jgi:hypothetical protein
LSETRVAVCLNLGQVFVLWQAGALEGSDQPPRLSIPFEYCDGAEGGI